MTTQDTSAVDDKKDNKEKNKSAAKKSGTKKSPSAFRTISEVADILDVQQHVLRFWETKFTQIKPLKRGGGRRYYRPEDVELLKRIHNLLYREKYTIKGVQKLLKGQGKSQILNSPIGDKPMVKVVEQVVEANDKSTEDKPSDGDSGLTKRQRVILKSMLGELKDLRDMITTD